MVVISKIQSRENLLFPIRDKFTFLAGWFHSWMKRTKVWRKNKTPKKSDRAKALTCYECFLRSKEQKTQRLGQSGELLALWSKVNASVETFVNKGLFKAGEICFCVTALTKPLFKFSVRLSKPELTSALAAAFSHKLLTLFCKWLQQHCLTYEWHWSCGIIANSHLK